MEIPASIHHRIRDQALIKRRQRIRIPGKPWDVSAPRVYRFDLCCVESQQRRVVPLRADNFLED
jgi:hypothetical protein